MSGTFGIPVGLYPVLAKDFTREIEKYFETAINESYHDTKEYTQAELDSGLKPERFLQEYLHTPKTNNLNLPVRDTK